MLFFQCKALPLMPCTLRIKNRAAIASTLSLILLSSCHPLVPGTPLPEYDNAALHQSSPNEEQRSQQLLRQNWYALYDDLRSHCVELNQQCDNEEKYQTLMQCIRMDNAQADFHCPPPLAERQAEAHAQAVQTAEENKRQLKKLEKTHRVATFIAGPGTVPVGEPFNIMPYTNDNVQKCLASAVKWNRENHGTAHSCFIMEVQHDGESGQIVYKVMY